MRSTPESLDSDAMSNGSQGTLSSIFAIVNYAIGKMRRTWSITDIEAADLQQDGYIAAIAANKTFDPNKGAWSTWVLKRVNGQLRTSLVRMRNGGVVGAPFSRIPVVQATTGNPDKDKDDEEIDTETQLIATDVATDDAADTAALIETVGNCVSSLGKQVLTAYYGLDGRPPVSLSQLAPRLGIGSKTEAHRALTKALAEARACVS